MKIVVMSPCVEGLPIKVTFSAALRAHRGKLVSGQAERGKEVHAASFLRRRRIVLDAALKKQPSEMRRILIHELFHFVWLRLGNPKRQSFESLLRGEARKRIHGELGWSAEHLKLALERQDSAVRTRRWREYVCESFCDTAAFLLARARRHDEFTLPVGARVQRRRWFERARLMRRISL